MFTVDWFEKVAKKNFEKHLMPLAGKKNLNFLEVGCYEGQATVWLLKNILTDKSSKICVIDTFEGSVEHQEKKEELKIDTLKKRFDENISFYYNQVKVYIGYSYDMLRMLTKLFDFIYIDASHQSVNVIEDAVLSFRLLKLNGIIAFDDYKWNGISDPLQHPKVALDAFLAIYSNKLLIIEKNYQLFIKKIEI